MFVSLLLKWQPPSWQQAETSSKRGAEDQSESVRKWESFDSRAPASFQMRKLKLKFCSPTGIYFFDLALQKLSSNNREKDVDTKKNQYKVHPLSAWPDLFFIPQPKCEIVSASGSCLKYRNRWTQVDMSQVLRISGI